MWKYVASGMIAFGTAFAIAAGATRGTSTLGSHGASISIEQEMVKAAEIANAKRGQVTGRATFTGARAHGATLVYDYSVGHAPKNFNSAAASERARQLIEREVCRSPLSGPLRRGATVVFRYASDTGRDLYEARVNATTCRLG